MRKTRVIPVLLIHDGGLYKTVQFKNPQYIGDPVNTIRLFNDLGADEIAILDIDASQSKRSPNMRLLSEIAEEAFVPLAYGGGVSTVDEANAVLKTGFEKIVVNSAARSDPFLIESLAKTFGSQSVVASIDYGKRLFGGHSVYDYINKKFLKKPIVQCCMEAEASGAGELLLTCIDRDGKMKGMDINTIGEIAGKVEIPVIACGGAGSLEDLRQAQNAGASAIAGGSMFVFRGNAHGILINYPKESSLQEYLQ